MPPLISCGVVSRRERVSYWFFLFCYFQLLFGWLLYILYIDRERERGRERDPIPTTIAPCGKCRLGAVFSWELDRHRRISLGLTEGHRCRLGASPLYHRRRRSSSSRIGAVSVTDALPLPPPTLLILGVTSPLISLAFFNLPCSNVYRTRINERSVSLTPFDHEKWRYEKKASASSSSSCPKLAQRAQR